MDFKEKIEHAYFNYFDLSKLKYKNAESNIIIICPKHGEFSVLAKSFLNGQGCKFCSKENNPVKFRSVPKEENGTKVICENNIYFSISEASELTGIPRYKIKNSCENGIEINGKLFEYYYGEVKKEKTNIIQSNSKKVYCLELDKSFDSITIAKKYMLENYNISIYFTPFKASGKLNGKNLHWCFLEDKNLLIEKLNKKLSVEEINNSLKGLKVIEYTDTKNKMKVVCENNHTFSGYYFNLVKYGCNKCKQELKAKEKTIEFQNKVKKSYNGIYSTNDSYKNRDTKINFHCSIHNLNFKQYPNKFFNGSICPECKNHRFDNLNYKDLDLSNPKKSYEELINFAISQNRKKGDDYFEEHHILPRSLGGTNDKNNLVLLTAQEHFKAHIYLYHFNNCKQTAMALQFFLNLANGYNLELYEKVVKDASYSDKGIPVYCLELDKEFKNATSAGKELFNNTGSSITSCCRGKIKTYGEKLISGKKLRLHWCYLKDKETLINNKEQLLYESEHFWELKGKSISKAKAMTFEEFVNRCNEKYKGKYTYKNWNGLQKLIDINCKEHGYFSLYATNHLNGQICPLCKKEIAGNANRVYWLEGDKSFNSITECAKELNYSIDFISKCCLKQYPNVFGNHFCYESEKDDFISRKEELVKEEPKIIKSIKQIYCITNGKTYKYTKDAAEDTGISASSIKRICRGEKVNVPFEFKYV